MVDPSEVGVAMMLCVRCGFLEATKIKTNGREHKLEINTKNGSIGPGIKLRLESRNPAASKTEMFAMIKHTKTMPSIDRTIFQGFVSCHMMWS